MAEMRTEFIPPNLVNLYNDLIDLQLVQGVVQVEVPGKEVLDAWKEGIPILALKGPNLNIDNFFAVMEKVKNILQKYLPESAGSLEKVYAAMPGDPGEREDLMKSILRNDNMWVGKLNRGKDIQLETMGFLVASTVRPFLRGYAEAVCDYIDYKKWGKGICPVCGSKPAIAKLGKATGQRYLYCNQCDTEWPYDRTGCPYCNNNEGKARFFTVESHPMYRVYVCDNCQGYLKTIDENKTKEKLEMFWEDVKTVYLDFAAIQEGFRFMIQGV